MKKVTIILICIIGSLLILVTYLLGRFVILPKVFTSTLPVVSQSPIELPTSPAPSIPKPLVSTTEDNCKKYVGYTCQEYVNAWMAIFKSENNLTDSNFASYISDVSASITPQGTNFELKVTYKFSKSWFPPVTRMDTMMLWNSDRTHLTTPNELPLERSSVTTGRVGVSTIHLTYPFVFSSESEALFYFVNAHNVENTGATVWQRGAEYFWNYEHNPTSVIHGGDLFLNIQGTLDASDNECYSGMISLHSKESTYSEGPCAIS